MLLLFIHILLIRVVLISPNQRSFGLFSVLEVGDVDDEQNDERYNCHCQILEELLILSDSSILSVIVAFILRFINEPIKYKFIVYALITHLFILFIFVDLVHQFIDIHNSSVIVHWITECFTEFTGFFVDVR